MGEYLVIDNNVIVNIIVCESDSVAAIFGAVPAYAGAMIGDKYIHVATSEEKERMIAQSKDALVGDVASHPGVWSVGVLSACTGEKE